MVIIDAKVPKEELPPPIEDLKDKVISNKTEKGDAGAHEVVKETPKEVVAPPPPHEPKEVIKPIDKPFDVVEQMPSYGTGDKALFQYLSENIKYPAVARENGIEGTVYLGFVVDTEGNITNVTVKRGVTGGCTEEAIRVVQGMPKWKPGKQQGRAVKVNFTLPIKFKLN
jgi:periplasmic protein TonB